MNSNFNRADTREPRTADEIFDGLSTEKMREVCDLVYRDEQLTAARKAQPKEIAKFLALCPDFDDTISPGNHNGPLIAAELRLRGLDPATADARDFQDAWEHVKAAGFEVKRNKSAILQQQQDDIGQEVREIQANDVFDEAEASRMPLDELRERADRALGGRR